MNGRDEKRRTSILKRRQSIGDDEATATINTKMQRKLMFSQKKEVLEFAQSDENLTIWGDKYETSVARSEGGSSDGGASTSHQTTSDFHSMHATSHTVSTTTTTSMLMLIEAEKENYVVVEKENVSVIEQTTSRQSLSKRLSDDVPELSIFFDPEEKTKMKHCPPANLNLTNMPLDSSVLAPNKYIQNVIQSDQCQKVLSPRKTVFLNRDFAVCVQDKVLSVPSAPEERISFNLEEDEDLKKSVLRKTMIKSVDMDISTDEKKPSLIFKHPPVPKEFKFRKSLSSPPIKPDHAMNRQEIDDIYDIIVQDTPSKNLCCLTPQRSHEVKAKAMSRVKRSNLLLHEFGLSESKSTSSIEEKSTSKIVDVTDCSLKMDFTNDDDDTAGTFETTDELAKKASRLLKNPDATLRMLCRPSSSVNSTLNLDESINLSKPMGLARSTTYALHEMSMNNESFPIFHDSMVDNEIDNNNEMLKPRVTVYNQDMSMNQSKNASMASGFGADISYNNPRKGSRETVYDQDISQLQSAPKGSRTTIYSKEMSMSEPYKEEIIRKSLSQQFDADSMEETILDEKVKGARATTYELNGMDESTTEKMPEGVKQNSRGTIYSANPMELSLTQKAHNSKEISGEIKQAKTRFTVFEEEKMDESPQIACKQRSTIFQQNDMDLTKFEESKPIPLKSRMTTYKHDEMDLSVNEIVPQMKRVSKNRPTTFMLNEMDLSTTEELTAPKQRVTSFQQNEMELSRSESIQPVSKCRATTFQNKEMEILPNENDHVQEKPTKSRVTTFKKEEMDESMEEAVSDVVPKILSKHAGIKNRATTFQTAMDMSCGAGEASGYDQSIMRECISNINEHDLEFSISQIPTHNESIKRTTIHIEPPQRIDRSLLRKSKIEEPEELDVSIKEPSFYNRPTIYDDDEHHMDKEEGAARKTVYNCDIDESTQENKYAFKSRPTSFEQCEMNESGESTGCIPKFANYRPSIFKQCEMDIEKDFKTRPTLCQLSEMETSGIDVLSSQRAKQSDSESMQHAIFSPPSAFKSSHSDRSVMVRQDEAGPSSMINQRKTSYEQEDMDTNDNHRRKTFTVKTEVKEDSFKWHNLTDADLNLIDDESDPCIEDESTAEPSRKLKKPKISLGNISRYEDAIDDFVNLTIASSPLNVSGHFNHEIPPAQSKRVSYPLLPDRDYSKMLDNLCETLKKKNAPKPRLAIDEYLEKLQIAPIKIERRLDLESNAIMERINAKKDEIRKRRESKMIVEQERNSMLPEIPDAVFLMRNFIESMDIEIRQRVERGVIISPIFPESSNFEFLLKNKFETDAHLSKYWKLDTTFWWMKNLKFTHKKLVFFTISINSQQSLTEADESTMPILFSNAILILGFNFRYDFKFPKRWQMMMNEFKNAINGVCNFNSICRSSSDLLPFLDYYHEKVKKVFEIVENFIGIVKKYNAILKKDKNGDHFFVKKAHFLQPDTEGYVEVLSVTIPVYNHIESINVQQVTVMGKLFEYHQILPSVTSFTGLMLLENILFDVEKFVAGNFRSQKINY